MRAGHSAKRLNGWPMTRPATAPTPTTGVAAGAVTLEAVRTDATTIAAASPSGTTRTPLTCIPAARSTTTPQPAPMAASRTGKRTHETVSDKDVTLCGPRRWLELARRPVCGASEAGRSPVGQAERRLRGRRCARPAHARAGRGHRRAPRRRACHSGSCGAPPLPSGDRLVAGATDCALPVSRTSERPTKGRAHARIGRPAAAPGSTRLAAALSPIARVACRSPRVARVGSERTTWTHP